MCVCEVSVSSSPTPRPAPCLPSACGGPSHRNLAPRPRKSAAGGPGLAAWGERVWGKEGRWPPLEGHRARVAVPFSLGWGGVCVCEGHGLPATRVGVVAGVLGGKSGT